MQHGLDRLSSRILTGAIRSLITGVDVWLVGVRALSSGVKVEGVVEDGRRAAGHETELWGRQC